MNRNDDLAQPVALVTKFEKLDKSILEYIENKNFDILEETFAAKREIKRFLAGHQPLKVDQGLALKLKKIRDNYGYMIDGVVEVISKHTGEVYSQESEEGIDYVEALFTEGTADYVDEEFFTRKNQVGTLLIGESLPDHFLHHFAKFRECYALGLFEATVIYCRAVLETGCFEALRRKGKVNPHSKVEDLREYSLKALMRSIKSLIYGKNWDAADKVIKKADDILHSKREKVIVSQEEAYAAIKTTFAVIEELFSGVSRQKQRG
jgi:hypothetical protein